MNKKLSWIILISAAVLGAALWVLFALPRYTSIHHSISQSKAVHKAQDFLKTAYGVDTKPYYVSCIFTADEQADRYLQKTIGFEQENKFLQKQGHDLFFWIVRFFKEQNKEEFRVVVSSQTGQVIGLSHEIDDSAVRPVMDEAEARVQAFAFLTKNFGFNPADYTIHNQQSRKFDHRQDHAFVWEKNNIAIAWSKDPQAPGAKLVSNVVISGGDILSFSKNSLEIPDAFNRYVENLKETGKNLTLVFRLLYLALLTMSIMFVVNRKQNLVLRVVRPFYWRAAVVLLVVLILGAFNDLYITLFAYPTTQSLKSYLVRELIESLINPLFIVLAFILPCLAGEDVCYEVNAQHPKSALLSNILSTFWSKGTAKNILAGYFTGIIVLGLQAVMFEFGYRYCGVWQELTWMTQSSTAIIPALVALLIGMQASFAEEGMFRLFGINMGLKYFKNTTAAVLVSAIIWGFGHTGYEIFPMWFRGLEVTALGIVLGVVYLRFGLIATITAHFLMDVILASLPIY